jgi:hypothetical protein
MKPIVFLGLLFLSPSIAFAQDPNSAQVELKLGYDLREQGKCLDAVAHFETSDRIAPQARTILNLSDCEQKLHRYSEAEVHAVLGMERARRENNDELVAVAEAQLASLPVIPDTLASFDMPILSHIADVPHVMTETRKKSKAIVWGLGITSAAAMGVGTVMGLEALTKNHDSNTSNQCNASGCNSSGYALRSQARTDALVSNVAFGVGIASLLVGGVMLRVRW